MILKKIKGKKTIRTVKYAPYEYLDKKVNLSQKISNKKFHLEDFNSTMGFSFPYVLINSFLN